MSKDAVEKKGILGKISALLDRLISFFEKDRFNLITAFIFMVIIGVVRSVAESLIFEYPIFSMYLVIQHTAFNFPVLVMGALILSMASDTSLRKVYNTILPGFAIVMLPPFIDYFVLGYSGAEHSQIYAYYAADVEFIHKIPDLNPFNMLLAEEISGGLKRMGVSIMFLSGLYVAVKVKLFESVQQLFQSRIRPLFKNIFALFFGVYGIVVVIWFISSIVPTVITFDTGGIVIFDYTTIRPPVSHYLFIENYGFTYTEIIGTEQELGLAGRLAQQQRSLFITMVFFILTTFFMIISLHIKHKKLLKKIFSTLRAPILLISTISSLLGSAVLHLTDPTFENGWALDPTYVLHIPYIFYIAGMGFLLGCFASFVLDYHKNKPILPQWVSKNMAIASLLAGGSFAFLMCPGTKFTVFLIAAGLIYIVFRRGTMTFPPLESLALSSACLFLYFLGISTPTIWKMRAWDTTIDLSRTPYISGSIMLLGLIIFLMVFMGNMIPYLVDRDFFTHNKSLGVAAFSLVLIPLLMFNQPWDMLIFGVLGATSFMLTDEDLPFIPLMVSTIGLIYIVLRLWGASLPMM